MSVAASKNRIEIVAYSPVNADLMSCETKWKQDSPKRLRPGLYRRGQKIYARVWINGRRTFRCTGTNTPSVAERVLEQFQNQEALRQNGVEPLIPALQRKKTVSKLIDEYTAAGYPDSKMQSKRATTANTERKCFARLRPFFGNKDASKLTLADCDQYRDWRINGGFNYQRMGKTCAKKVGNRVVDVELQTLSNVLGYAVRRGYMRTNPVNGRTRYHREENTRHCREVAPNQDQLRLIEKSLRAEGKTTIADCILFLAFSGLRVNEALSLLWSNVDWPRQMIHVKRQKRGINPFVPIGTEMRGFLKKMQSRSRSPYLFPSAEDAGKPIAYPTVAHQLRELCLTTQMKYVTLHGLRSFFVTQSRQSGLLDSEIAALIGDKTGAAIIAQTYGDFLPDHLLKRANQIRLLAS